jgi:hypothetical protein
MTETSTIPVRRGGKHLTGPWAFVAAWTSCTLAATGWVLVDAAGTNPETGGAAWLVAASGTASVTISAVAGALLRRRPAWRPVAAVVLCALAVLTIPFLGWFTALPAYLGVAAAWVGGPLDPGANVPGTAPRIAGVLGTAIAMLAGLIFTGGLLVTLLGTLR